MDITELQPKTLEQLRVVAREWDIPAYSRLKKDDLILRLLRANAEKQGLELRGGVLEVVEDGIGFLRAEHLMPGPEDIYVSQSQIRRFGLRTGDMVIGQVRAPKDSEKYYGLLRVETVNGIDPEQAKKRPSFESLTPIFPDVRFDLETNRNILSPALPEPDRAHRQGPARPDRLAAQGGQDHRAERGGQRHQPQLSRRAPDGDADRRAAGRSDRHGPLGGGRGDCLDLRRAGDLARAGGRNGAGARQAPGGGRPARGHPARTRSTRLARAYNLVVNPSGRTLSGGLDPAALYPPKKFFGAARNIEEGGSLTIVATCLVDTGSRMDDVVYEEFKGTGNMELHLSRKLQERRIFPAFDIERSSTRREELLLGPDITPRVWLMRRMFGQMITPPPERGRHGPDQRHRGHPRPAAPDRQQHGVPRARSARTGGSPPARP